MTTMQANNSQFRTDCIMEVPNRDAVAREHTWDLSLLYADLESWKQDYLLLEEDAPSIKNYQGRLGESASTLTEAVHRYLGVLRRLEKLYVYAQLRSDQDKSNASNLGHVQQAFNLYSRFAAWSSYISPEILAIDSEKFASFLTSAGLAPFTRWLKQIVRYKPHTLSQAEENLLAMGSEVFASSEKIFSQLNDADLDFGMVEADGKEQRLTHGNFIVFLQNTNRIVREAVFLRYYQEFDAHRNTIAASLTGSLQRDVYFSRVRNYPSCLEHALFHDNVPASVYLNLINTVSGGLDALYHYYELRKQKLNLSSMCLFDTHVPLVPHIESKLSYEESVELAISALAPLGEEYGKILRSGLLPERWVDRYENRGKRSGAYSSGCYDSVPYILLNYKDDTLNSLFTLVHEAGHSMHTYYSNRRQPYQDHDYTIFAAEVASTFNEHLLITHLKQKYSSDKRMLAYLINHQIDDIKATFYRQTMFAEFEKQAHEIVERNEPLTIDVYRSLYGELLRKYFGKTLEIGELDDLECLRIPHFYNAFYVYKYAVGISAAIDLAEKVLSGDETARARYLAFLQSGGTKFPIELLRDAGVDVAKSDSIENTVRLFSKLVNEFKQLS